MQAQTLRVRRSSKRAALRLGSAIEPKATGAIGKRLKLSTANHSALPERTESPVAARSRGLNQHEPDQQADQAARRSGKAQGALPSYKSGAAAAEYGSRNMLMLASAESTATPWSSDRLQRGAGNVRRVFGSSTPAGLPSARPNPSLKLTRYGRLCKPGLRYPVHLLSPGLQSLPPRAA
jgi:hypothetical protein